MATESIRVSALFSAPPGRIYQAWLSSEEHSTMTGGAATVEPNVGGRHSAWDGYIHGETVSLDPDRRIVQTWRTTEFPAGSPHSQIEVLFEAIDGGTRVVIDHREIPEGQAAGYERGWLDFYFSPMADYFGEFITESGETRAREFSELSSAPEDLEELSIHEGVSLGSSGSTVGYSAAELFDEATPLPRDDEDTATDDLSGIAIDAVLGQFASQRRAAARERSAKKATAAKAPAKKAAAKAPGKKAAAAKVPAKKAVAAKALGKKAVVAKAPAKRAVAAKAPAKKAVAAKAPAKKAVAAKVPAKKAVAAKVPAKKAAAAKVPAKKAVATKVPAKKAAAAKVPAKKAAAAKVPAKKVAAAGQKRPAKR